MAKRGRPRKNNPDETVVPEVSAEVSQEIKEPEIKKVNVGFPIPDGARISVSPVMEPSLTSPDSDPFEKHKTDPDRFHYRALNKKPQNISVKEAMGYETIGGSAFGDLVLARIPKERRQAREEYQKKKAENQIKAARESFRDKARRNGFETFDAVNEKKK